MDEHSRWNIKIGNLKLHLGDYGIIGTNSSTPTKITINGMKKIYGYTLISSHVGIYMEYKTYVEGNTIYAYSKSETPGHSTVVFAIGI